MTSPVEAVVVHCPNAGCRVETFRDWQRASVNPALDPELAHDEDYMRQAGTATCPACGTVVELLEPLVLADGPSRVEAPVIACPAGHVVSRLWRATSDTQFELVDGDQGLEVGAPCPVCGAGLVDTRVLIDPEGTR